MVVAIIVIVLIAVFFIYLIGSYIYKKKNHLPTGDCACCSKTNKKRFYKQFRKKYPK